LLEKAKVMLLKAIALDPTDAISHALLGEVYCSISDYDRGLAEFDKALALNPNDPDALFHIAAYRALAGGAKEGAEMVDRMFRLNPHYPPWYNNAVDAYYAAGQYDKIVNMVLRTIGDVATWTQMVLVMSYGQLGRQADVIKAKAKLLELYPDFSMERALSDFGTIPDQPTLAHYLDGVRKVGLNECATQAELQKYPQMTHLALCDTRRAAN
jgi:tetratricopeptide (TPR) repeat protein